MVNQEIFLMRDIQVFMRYKAWADDLFLSALLPLTDDVLLAPRPIVFGSLLHTLYHAYQMDYVWQCHLQGVPHGLTSRNPDDCPPFADLIEKQRVMNDWYIHYAELSSEAELDEVVTFEFIDGGVGRMSRREILLHVVNHATYHRGHAAGMLYPLGISPPTTDLPVFLREITPSVTST